MATTSLSITAALPTTRRFEGTSSRPTASVAHISARAHVRGARVSARSCAKTARNGRAGVVTRAGIVEKLTAEELEVKAVQADPRGLESTLVSTLRL